MKQYVKTLLLAAVAFLATACGMDKLSTEAPDAKGEKGYLQIGGVVVNSDTENSVVGGRAVTEADGNYYLEVIDKRSGGSVWSGTYADLREGSTIKPIGLEPGTYVVYAYQTAAKKPAEGVAVDARYYAGHSDDIEIISKQTKSVSVTCRLANILTTVELSADLRTVFKDYADLTDENRLKTNVEVGTSTTTNAYDFEETATHTAPMVYFRDEAGPNSTSGNTMSIVLSGDYYTGDPVDVINGTPDNTLWKHVKMAKTLTNVRAAQWRKISIDIDHNTTGTAQFVFTIESYVYDEEITVDVITLYSELNEEEAIPDDEEENPAAPTVTISGQSDLNYSINSAMFDEMQNIWTKWLTVNITPNDGTTVQEVSAVITSTNTALLPAMEAKGFTEGHIDFFPTNAATDYATVSADGRIITLVQNGMSALYKYPGTHTVSVCTVDSDNRLKHTDLIITVTGGAVVGPVISWWVDGVPSTTMNMVENESGRTAGVDLTSASGLTGMTVEVNIEGLPAADLPSMGLASFMDIFEPANAMMETRLRAFGFLPIENFDPATMDRTTKAAEDDNYRIYDPATGERKAGAVSPLYMKQEVSFDISEFLGLLSGFPGTHTFVLKATDESGENTQTLTINVN